MSGPDIDRVVTATARSSPQEPAGTPDPNAVAVRGDQRVGFTIVAVAAGRGRRTATRSDIGARIAVDVAATRAEAAVAANGVPDAHALAEVGDVLAARVVEQWRAQVHQHVAAQPFAADELARVDGGPDDHDADPLPAYDAMLLLTIVTPQAVLALQIGNGDIVVRGIAGDMLQPVAGAATAGADQGAPGLAGTAEDAQHAVVDRASADVAMVMLATDGLAKALGGAAGITSLASDLASEAHAHGVDRVEEQLPRRLAELPRAGREDGEDITIALVFPAAYLAAAQVPRAVPPSLATIVNAEVPVAAAAAGAAATSAPPKDGVGSSGNGRRRLLAGTALIAGTALLMVGLAFALARDGGTPAPASPVPPTPTTKRTTTSVATTVTTSPPVSATTLPPSTTPSTVPPTAAPIVVTSPTTTKPLKKTTTTSTTRPKPTTTTTTTTTTLPVTSST